MQLVIDLEPEFGEFLCELATSQDMTVSQAVATVIMDWITGIARESEQRG